MHRPWLQGGGLREVHLRASLLAVIDFAFAAGAVICMRCLSGKTRPIPDA